MNPNAIILRNNDLPSALDDLTIPGTVFTQMGDEQYSVVLTDTNRLCELISEYFDVGDESFDDLELVSFYDSISHIPNTDVVFIQS